MNPAYDLGGALSKFIDLIMGLFGVLDAFIVQLHDSMVNGAGIGDGALQWLVIASWVPLMCMAAAFVWNVAEGIVHKAKNMGREGVPMENIKKCLQIGMFMALTVGARLAFSTDPANGTWFGISYPTITKSLDATAVEDSIRPLVALDIVTAWADALKESGALRREKIMEYIGTQDLATQDTYAKRILYVTTNGDANLMGLGDWAGVATNLGAELLNGELVASGARNLLNSAFMGLIAMACVVAMGAFIFQAARTIILLVFYLKLGVLLTMSVIPFAIGVLYFKSLRHMGLAIIKQVLVLMIVAGALTGAVKTVFSQDALTQAMAAALRANLAPLTSPITDREVMDFKAEIDTAVVNQVLGSPTNPDPLNGLSLQQGFDSALVMIKMMFVLGIMLMILSKIVDVITGLIDGHWDPFQHGAEAAG